MNKKINLIKSNQKLTAKEKIRRLSWSLCSPPIFNLPGRLFSPLRVCLLRLFGSQIGNKVLICSGVHIWLPWNLHIGNHSAIGRKVEIYGYAPIYIGSDTVISQYAYLCGASHDYESSSMDLTSEPIKIGNYCWIAANAMITQGVSIGEGTVIGARSVVTKSMPEWIVAAGIPARIIKDRVIKK